MPPLLTLSADVPGTIATQRPSPLPRADSCSTTFHNGASAAPTVTSSSLLRTRSLRGCSCLSRENAKDWGPCRPLRSMASHDNDIIRCTNNSRHKGSSASRTRNADPRPTQSAPTRSTQVIRHRFLDPDASVDIITQKLRQTASPSAPGVSNGSWKGMDFKKKFYRYRPGLEPTIEVRTTQTRTKPVPCDPRDIEYGVRQFLADKVMGNLARHLAARPRAAPLGRLGPGVRLDAQRPERVEPRLALQLIHEAALCRTGLRHRRTLNQRTSNWSTDCRSSPPIGPSTNCSGLAPSPIPAAPSGPRQAPPRLGPFPRAAPGHRPASRAELQQAVELSA